jgi:hypothetical protein
MCYARARSFIRAGWSAACGCMGACGGMWWGTKAGLFNFKLIQITWVNVLTMYVCSFIVCVWIR